METEGIFDKAMDSQTFAKDDVAGKVTTNVNWELSSLPVIY
jgi:hypothetical protein